MVIKEQIYEIMRAILYIIYIIKCKGNLLSAEEYNWELDWNAIPPKLQKNLVFGALDEFL